MHFNVSVIVERSNNCFFYDGELYMSVSYVGNRHKFVFLEQSSPSSVVCGTLVTVHGH